MPNLEQYFQPERKLYDSHPLIRSLEREMTSPNFQSVKLEFQRERLVLGVGPAEMRIAIEFKEGIVPIGIVSTWDPLVNTALIDRGYQAVDEANEITRFGLMLWDELERIEISYGGGFFNTILMVTIDESPFATVKPISELRPFISTSQIRPKPQAAEECGAMIKAVLQERWSELRNKLRYSESEAERILAGAIASYLDTRFSITDARKFGLISSS